VSASEIIKELPKLSEIERRAVLDKLRELASRDEDVRLCEQAAGEQAAQLDRLEEAALKYGAVDLQSRGISEAQARLPGAATGRSPDSKDQVSHEWTRIFTDSMKFLTCVSSVLTCGRKATAAINDPGYNIPVATGLWPVDVNC
jgi:hypothetical protein